MRTYTAPLARIAISLFTIFTCFPSLFRSCFFIPKGFTPNIFRELLKGDRKYKNIQDLARVLSPQQLNYSKSRIQQIYPLQFTQHGLSFCRLGNARNSYLSERNHRLPLSQMTNFRLLNSKSLQTII